jgi:hypothetical protein
MLSKWEQSKKKSNYHFDNFKNDSQVDKVIKLGKIIADYSEDVKHAVETAKPAKWGDLDEINSEEHLISKDYKITHLSRELTINTQKISDLFGLKNCTGHIYVQMPGNVWNLHLDSLINLAPEEPWNIMRVQISLTDWEQGHFCNYGNYNHQQWRAGDVTTFDWQNLPHSTANAGHNPNVTLQLTGIITEKTTDFLNRLKRFGDHQLTLKDNAWF